MSIIVYVRVQLVFPNAPFYSNNYSLYRHVENYMTLYHQRYSLKEFTGIKQLITVSVLLLTAHRSVHTCGYGTETLSV